ncbi:unnamed protein product [Ilex paraguariensis]|uniref:OCRE domain-containing protein n=1 Tax=Ilex paraguariensis TaxID=185542 RepID=A0ABC8T4F3_9AQUA
MDERPSGDRLKRPLVEDDDSDKPPAQKRIRYPKGKKVKEGNSVVDLRQNPQDVPSGWRDPRLAAKERAMQRNRITAELLSEENRGMIHDISQAEEHYEETLWALASSTEQFLKMPSAIRWSGTCDGEIFVQDGVQVEPFNLTKEREEGYFDADGNYVEYLNDNDIKDAWLDNVDVDTKFAERSSTVTNDEDGTPDLSSEQIGKMKRRIADVLEPGETVLQALRRLKGTTNSRKEKMSPETKLLFDQLTEDAMKLMENEGYERLAQARGQGTSTSAGQENLDYTVSQDFVPNGKDTESVSSVTAVGPSNLNVSTDASNDDALDMFAEDDENATANPSFDGSAFPGGNLQNDYVYDESSGYYYSSSLGYYYDPSSGLYCCAASGQWYSYNEETGAYDEIQEAASIAS